MKSAKMRLIDDQKTSFYDRWHQSIQFGDRMELQVLCLWIEVPFGFNELLG